MGVTDMDATLKSFGVDLLALCEQMGADHVSVFADATDGEPYVHGAAWLGDEKLAGVDLFVEDGDGKEGHEDE